MKRREFLQWAAASALGFVLTGGEWRRGSRTRREALAQEIAIEFLPTADPPAGEVNVLALDPLHPQTLYAATDSVGVFKSVNGAESWEQLPGTRTHVFALALAPSHPQIVYAGYNYGVIKKTTDGGRHWRPMYDTDRSILSLAVDPRNPDVVYAGSLGRIVRSRDGGRSWQTVLSFDRRGAVRALGCDPQHPEIVYAGVASHHPGRGALLQSADGGSTWRHLAERGVLSLAITPEALYVGTPEGVWKREREGSEGFRRAGDLSQRVQALAASSQAVYAGTERGVFRSEDGGTTWEETAFPNDEPRGEVLTIVLDPEDPQIVYVGTRDGVFKSTDGGATAEPAGEGLVERGIVTVTADPNDPEVAYAGTGCSRGFFKTTDGGQSWAWIGGNAWSFEHTGLDDHYAMALVVNPQNSAIVYATTTTGIHKSTDGGLSWVTIETDFSGRYGRHLHGLALAPSDPQIIYVGTGRRVAGSPHDFFDGAFLFKSTDGGRTWQEITADFPTHRDTEIHVIVVDPVDPNVAYVGTSGHGIGGNDGEAIGIYKTADGGASWRAINRGLLSLEISGLALDPFEPQTLYAATEQGLAKSEDAGLSWIPLSGPVAARAVTAVAVDPVRPGVVYAAVRDEGVFVSEDGGRSWIQVAALPLFPSSRREGGVRALSLDSQGRVLYAAAPGRGILKALLRP